MQDIDEALYYIKLNYDGFAVLCSIFEDLYYHEMHIYSMRSDDVHVFVNFLGEMDSSMLYTWEEEVSVIMDHIHDFREEVVNMSNRMKNILDYTNSIVLFENISDKVIKLYNEDSDCLKDYIAEFTKDFNNLIDVLSDKYRNLINLMGVANDNFERLSVMMRVINVDMFRLYKDADDYELRSNISSCGG